MFLLLFYSLALQAADTGLVNLWKMDMSIPLAKKPCVLRKPVAEALTRVQSLLRLQEVGLKVTTCYVPSSENPDKSLKQSRGASVEVVLVDRQGEDWKPPALPRKGKKSEKNTSRFILDKAMDQEGFSRATKVGTGYDFRGWETFETLDIPLSKFP
jgi:D-alanyl-D-alanine dipeptidase